MTEADLRGVEEFWSRELCPEPGGAPLRSGARLLPLDLSEITTRQQAAHLFYESLLSEGFRDRRDSALGDGRPRRGHQEHGCRWGEIPNRMQQLVPIDSGHHIVGEHQVYRVLRIFKYLQCFIAVRCSQHPVATPGQDRSGDEANGRFVIGHQDGSGFSRSPVRALKRDRATLCLQYVRAVHPAGKNYRFFWRLRRLKVRLTGIKRPQGTSGRRGPTAYTNKNRIFFDRWTPALG